MPVFQHAGINELIDQILSELNYMQKIDQCLKSLGVKRIHAESRQTSLRFYLKNGYTEMPFNDSEKHESNPNDVPVR